MFSSLYVEHIGFHLLNLLLSEGEVCVSRFLVSRIIAVLVPTVQSPVVPAFENCALPVTDRDFAVDIHKATPTFVKITSTRETDLMLGTWHMTPEKGLKNGLEFCQCCRTRSYVEYYLFEAK